MFYIPPQLREGKRSGPRASKRKRHQSCFPLYTIAHFANGKKLGYPVGDLPVTEAASSRLLRLPMYYELTKPEQDYIIDSSTLFEASKACL